jgi:hypothetical protein
MAFETTTALGNLMFGHCCQETGDHGQTRTARHCHSA